MTAEPWASVEDAAKHLGAVRDSAYRWIDGRYLPALEIYDAMAEAARTGTPYQTRLDPPPADPRVAHPDTRPAAEKKGAR